jgi:ATP-dependent RNA helicase RhlE
VTFAALGLPTPILKGVRASGLTEPTAIQSKAIPVILQGNDLIGAAQSGAGKTGAYSLPILARLLDLSTTRLRAIVLVPTSELAQYVETRARDYARYTNVKIGVVFTGGSLQQQERMLRDQEVDMLVATPGRLIELHSRGIVNFENVEILVLDEADRMVALGLAPDLRRLLKLLPETRQTLMFAVTMPPELNRLAKEALIEPVRVDLAPPSRPSTGIMQAIYPVPKELKPDLLHEMLSRAEVRNTVVCTRARYGADRLAKQLMRRGYAVKALDDHPNQSEREQALDDLKRGKTQILVASDAASRSMDLTGVSHVINYDVPKTPEDYVHRLGRAGRPDQVGDCFTLMSPEEQRDVAAIERFLGRAIPRVMLPDFDYDMRPTDMKAAYEDEARAQARERARGAHGGLQAAATKIAHAPRAANGVTRAPAAAVSRASAATVARPRPSNGAARSVTSDSRPGSHGAKKPAPAARSHRAVTASKSGAVKSGSKRK